MIGNKFISGVLLSPVFLHMVGKMVHISVRLDLQLRTFNVNDEDG